MWAQTILKLYGSTTLNQLSRAPHCSSFLKTVLELSTFYSISVIPQTTTSTATWRWTTQGAFTTSSAYARLHDRGFVDKINLALWSIKIPTKIKVFIWVAMRDSLLTQQILRERGCNVEPGCHLCNDRNVETSEHLLFSCTYAVCFWSELLSGWYAMLGGSQTHPGWSLWWSTRSNTQARLRNLWDAIWAAGCWALWKERNRRLFTQRRTEMRSLAANAAREAFNWYRVLGQGARDYVAV